MQPEVGRELEGRCVGYHAHLLERACAILHHSHLPQTLWGEAIHFATWLKNWSSTGILGNATPYCRFQREMPNLTGPLEWGRAKR